MSVILYGFSFRKMAVQMPLINVLQKPGVMTGCYYNFGSAQRLGNTSYWYDLNTCQQLYQANITVSVCKRVRKMHNYSNYAIFLNYFQQNFDSKICFLLTMCCMEFIDLLMTLNTISMISNETSKFLLVSTVQPGFFEVFAHVFSTNLCPASQ